MSKTVSYCALLVVASFLATVVVCKPELLSDGNSFLKALVDKDFLVISGVILTITLASSASVHLALNDIESRVGHAFLHRTRANVHSSSYWLIAMFLVATVLLILKPYFEHSVQAQSAFNSAALLILFWMILIMTSLTRLVFAIKPHFDDKE